MISTLSFSIHLFTRHFNHNHVTLPASGADRSNANSTATALQLISKCQYNPRAACADRMSKRYCTTIDVYFFRIKSCDFITRKRYRRESFVRSEEHTSELQSRGHLVCRLLLEKKNYSQ